MHNNGTSASPYGLSFDQVQDGWTEAQDQISLIGSLARQHGTTIAQGQRDTTLKAISALRDASARMYGPNLAAAFQEYIEDAAQRAVLFVDTLRRRGDSYIEREAEGFKPVLAFDYDIVMDGRELDRPVNYAMVRIRAPEGAPAQREDGRPFVIIDPRAGHGSGIGGFKSESEVGVAIRDGHPVYFVVFFPDPEPNQTLADVCAAEAEFLKEVARRHPNAPHPLVIGNCQGGWATMILSATHPNLTGPLVIAGAPLSYWAGEVGKNPFRYLGGVMGGAVPALLASDLGAGKFDGAHLVYNFEGLNPANTWWRKSYNVFANVDKEADRYLEFERWWSGFYFMNENEIRWIVENLFIGNKLTRGQAILNDGTPVDLTRIKAPIVVFASHGDNITPPQQALNWIPDLYGSVQELRARGHVIIYTLHDSVGHLGIFVSAKVACKQHKQITSVVKTIEALAPGLYEMTIDHSDDGYEVAFEDRTIDDILAYDDGRDEEASFGAVAQFSEWAVKTYELLWRPVLQSVVTPELADMNRKLHPMRQERYFFSNQNPLLSGLDDKAAEIRASRKPASPDNPFVAMENAWANAIEDGWNLFRESRDALLELSFFGLYGSPWMRRLGARGQATPMSHEPTQFPQVKEAIGKAAEGGYSEAIIRMLVLLARARGSVRRDRLERSNKILHSRPPFDTMTPEHRSQLIHEQSVIVEFAEKEAIATLPQLLRDDVDRVRALNLVMEVAGPVEEMDAPTIAMFKHLQFTLRTMARDWHEPEHIVSAHEPGTAPEASDTPKSANAG